MKKIKIILLLQLLIFSISIHAQKWETNFSKATELAKNDSKHIVLVFSGSDWCAPCINLEKEIWKTKEFQTLAKNDFVMLKADFPRRKKNRLSKFQEDQNEDLASKYNPQGFFPLVVVLDDKGTVLGTTGYKKSLPRDYYQDLKKFIK